MDFIFLLKLGYMGLRPVCFLVTFCTTQKVTTRSPSQGVSRFCKPQISTPQPQLCTATIKTFLREFRGFSNLESAHINSQFAQAQLNPFETFLSESFVPVGTAHSVCFFPPYGGASALLLPRQLLPLQGCFAASHTPYRNKKSFFISTASTGQNSWQQ